MTYRISVQPIQAKYTDCSSAHGDGKAASLSMSLLRDGPDRRGSLDYNVRIRVCTIQCNLVVVFGVRDGNAAMVQIVNPCHTLSDLDPMGAAACLNGWTSASEPEHWS